MYLFIHDWHIGLCLCDVHPFRFFGRRCLLLVLLSPPRSLVLFVQFFFLVHGLFSSFSLHQSLTCRCLPSSRSAFRSLMRWTFFHHFEVQVLSFCHFTFVSCVLGSHPISSCESDKTFYFFTQVKCGRNTDPDWLNVGIIWLKGRLKSINWSVFLFAFSAAAQRHALHSWGGDLTTLSLWFIGHRTLDGAAALLPQGSTWPLAFVLPFQLIQPRQENMTRAERPAKNKVWMSEWPPFRSPKKPTNVLTLVFLNGGLPTVTAKSIHLSIIV